MSSGSPSTGSPEPLPADAALPVVARLLDRGYLDELLGAPARPRYLEYHPGRRVLLLAETTGDGGHAAVGATAGDPQPRIHRYPHDPALPLLARPADLAELLGLPPAAPRLLAWMPHRRATLRLGEAVVKLYADRGEAAAAVAALRAAAPVLPTARPGPAAVAEGVVAQGVVPGVALRRADALGAAAQAAVLIRGLHRASLPGLPVTGPGELLAQCGPVVELVRRARPALAGPLDAALAALHATAPAGLDAVPTHGDFTMGQLLRDGGDLAVVDVDTLAAAPPALDLAAYAANLVSGRPGDVEDARAALAELVRGYGGRPPGLDWYLAASVLRRLDRALRRTKRDWPQRTGALLAAVEELARPGAG
jgi:aminoglycoside phosphotransferase (APT) family kinase protein